MAREIFVDAGAWIALSDADDEHHRAATRAYPTLFTNYRRLVTSNLVIAEAYAMLRRTLGHRPAMSFLDSLRQSPRIQKVIQRPTWSRKRSRSCANMPTRLSVSPTPSAWP